MENKKDLVDRAEEVIKSLINPKGRIDVTTSQIRKFLSAVTVLKNKLDVYFSQHPGEIIPENMAAEIKFLKVRILYNAAKGNNAVKDFVTRSALDKEIASIGNDRKKFNSFCQYVEALVAFHKYYGGKDK